MLGYLDFRHQALEWRKAAPKLAAFEKDFATRDSNEGLAPARVR